MSTAMRGIIISAAVFVSLLMSLSLWAVAIFKDGAPISAIGISALTLWVCVAVAGACAVVGSAIGGNKP